MSQKQAKHWVRLSLLGMVGVAGCTTPQGELVSETQCNAATALATYRWEVAYFPERDRQRPQRHRIETFASAELLNRNGEQPEGAATGPDDAGVWWPQLPERPTADQVDDRRQDNSRENEPPLLQRNVRYVLDCDDGKFAATDEMYRRLGRALREGKTVQAQYGMGQVMKTTIVESGETLEAPPSPVQEGDAGAGGEATAGGGAEETSAALTSSTTLLHVDPAASGQEAGTPEQPFKTITAALAQAESGMIIQLAPGNYGADSGERFPLPLSNGITLQGNPDNQGQDIVIRGGGSFISPTWAKQNATVVTQGEAQVIGLTVSNPNVRGSGIWVESDSPLIRSNTFTDNHREAVFVSGEASPRIEDNLIQDNGGNGVAFTKSSKGWLVGNTIQDSGYGVVVSDRAQPTLEANQISQNRSGIVLSGAANPTLRGNTIRAQEQDGIVATNQSQATLEGNILVENGEFDINSNSTGSIQTSEDISQLKIQGNL